MVPGGAGKAARRGPAQHQQERLNATTAEVISQAQSQTLRPTLLQAGHHLEDP